MTDAEVIARALAALPVNSNKPEPRAGPRLEDRLRHAQKMDALGQITGGIAHDFNNLLLAINFNLESLDEEVPDSARTRPLFDGARQAIEQAHGLIGHLLAFARRQPLSPTSVDINRSILETKLMLRRAMPAGIEVETRLGRTAGLVLADRNQFETALLNLALNARDAMPRGRPSHDRHRRHHARRSLCRAASGDRTRPLCSHRGQRYRAGHEPRHRGARL